MDAEDVEGAEGAVEGDNPLESFEAFGSWFNKQVESVAEQFNGGTGESDSDEDDDSIDGDANHDDDDVNVAKKTPASPKVKSPKKKSRPKSPAARRRDSENDRIRERTEREAEAIRRYRPSRPKAAAANLAARCGVRVGRILSVGTMHLVPPPGGSVRNGGSIDAGDEEGGADDFSSSPTGDLPEGGGGAGGEGPETEREKAERERNAGERARAMSELYRKMMDEQDRGAAGPTEGDDDGDKGGGDKGGDLTNYVDDAEIEAMLGETEAANEWSKVSDREYAWVKAVGKTCQAAMVEKTLGLIERYAPLRAYVRYWATVARADDGLRRSSRARGFAPTPRPVHIRRVAQGAHLRRLHDELHGRHDPVAGRARRRAGHRAPRAGHVLHHTAPPMPRRRVLGRRGRAGPRGWRGDARVFLRHRRARAPGRPAVRERPRRAHRRGIGRGERGG
jgi:hypothetical protein